MYRIPKNIVRNPHISFPSYFRLPCYDFMCLAHHKYFSPVCCYFRIGGASLLKGVFITASGILIVTLANEVEDGRSSLLVVSRTRLVTPVDGDRLIVVVVSVAPSVHAGYGKSTLNPPACSGPWPYWIRAADVVLSRKKNDEGGMWHVGVGLMVMELQMNGSWSRSDVENVGAVGGDTTSAD